MKPNTNQIVYREDEITALVTESGKLVFKASAEEELLKLLNLKDRIEEAIALAKTKIAEAGKQISPDFKGVVGQKLRVLYKKSGERYSYDRLNIPEEFMKVRSYRAVDSEKVDQYVKENGELPEGIIENEREDKLIIIKKNEEPALP